ncbi:M23 family metallopeptidase, partial [Vibrio cholerae O1]|nr:M23 family metallopeptidase [Vibrio cholerae O1]
MRRQGITDCRRQGEYHQWYLHLDKYNVKVGDRVKAGDIIAYSGNTGKQTTGAH